MFSLIQFCYTLPYIGLLFIGTPFVASANYTRNNNGEQTDIHGLTRFQFYALRWAASVVILGLIPIIMYLMYQLPLLFIGAAAILILVDAVLFGTRWLYVQNKVAEVKASGGNALVIYDEWRDKLVETPKVQKGKEY